MYTKIQQVSTLASNDLTNLPVWAKAVVPTLMFAFSILFWYMWFFFKKKYEKFDNSADKKAKMFYRFSVVFLTIASILLVVAIGIIIAETNSGIN